MAKPKGGRAKAKSRAKKAPRATKAQAARKKRTKLDTPRKKRASARGTSPVKKAKKGKKATATPKKRKKRFSGKTRTGAPVATPVKVEGAEEPISLAPEQARELIFTYLTDIDASLTSASRVRTHVYKDDTVDGEIVVDVGRGVDVQDVIFELGDALEYKSLGPWFWVAAGARYMIYSDDDVVYRKFDGMNEVHTYYQPMNRSNIAEVLLLLRTKVTTGMQRRFRRKASVIFLRLHYAPYGQKPTR